MTFFKYLGYKRLTSIVRGNTSLKTVLFQPFADLYKSERSLEHQTELSDYQHVPTSLDEILKKKTFLKILSPHEFLFLCKLAERLETRTAHQGQFTQKCLDK